MIENNKKIKVRHEYKYILQFDDYLGLREVLKKIMNKDINSKSEEGYHIRSLYFDDVANSAYYEKDLGIMNRRKFRIRIYNFSDSLIQLEEKVKYHDYIEKNSCKITKDEYNEIYHKKVEFLHDSGNELKERYYHNIRCKNLEPKVIVDYLREAYVLPYNDIRVTFDKQLATGMPYEDMFNNKLNTYSIYNDNSIILEVKYNNFLPGFLRDVLESYSSSRIAVSKYIICREKLNNVYRGKIYG